MIDIKGFISATCIEHDDVVAVYSMVTAPCLDEYMRTDALRRNLIEHISTNYSDVVRDARYDAYVETEMKKQIIITVPIVDHCNLACTNCYHMSSLAEPYTADEFDILNDIGLISALFKNTIYKYSLDITGGDPLLHPELAKILKNLPTCNPNESRSLTTNALEFPSLSYETIKAMRSISVNVSDYGINHAAVEKTKQICMDNSIMLNVNYRNVFEVARFSQCGGMGSLNRVDCNVDRRCICSVVRNGKFYPCAENFHVGKLKSGLPGFYVDLDQIETASQAILLMVLQQPLCRHCLVKERHVVRWTNGQNRLDTYLDKHI